MYDLSVVFGTEHVYSFSLFVSSQAWECVFAVIDIGV